MKTSKFLTVIVVLSIIICGCTHKSLEETEAYNLPVNNISDSELPNSTDELYNVIYNKIAGGEIKFSLSDVSEADVISRYNQIVSEHPELFWLNYGYSYQTATSQSGKTVTFECAHTSTDNLNEKKTYLSGIVESVVSEANKRNSIYEKLLYVHDYIVDNTQYDQQASVVINSSNGINVAYDATNAYGCLVNKKAVCSGYSAAFQLLMQRLGVSCGRVKGRKIGGEEHEWNYVVLDGEYYYIDVTWDDPIVSSLQDNKTYEFFCITSEELEQTHTVDADQFVPNCIADRYDYYVYNNLYLEKYDYNEFANIWKNNQSSDKISIKFSSSAELKNAITDLIGNNGIFGIANGRTSYSYSQGNSGRVLTILFN